jgi:hypothetical protein
VNLKVRGICISPFRLPCNPDKCNLFHAASSNNGSSRIKVNKLRGENQKYGRGLMVKVRRIAKQSKIEAGRLIGLNKSKGINQKNRCGRVGLDKKCLEVLTATQHLQQFE